MNPYSIIDKYYSAPGMEQLREELIIHSELVRDKAIECARRYEAKTGQSLDIGFISEAAMLHDIGIFRCNAPGIHCHGTEPYIRHGLEGGAILRAENLPKHALVCERHTGSGLTAEEIRHQNLPLPAVDMLPLSPEEKAICYADKFFSKSGDIRREKTLEEVERSMAHFGPDSLARFKALHSLFE
ncbi:MAG: phosphohydrolase [Bacteroidales bacterium]|nr:phosphohydrolase [Bacteroidales bacterium]